MRVKSRQNRLAHFSFKFKAIDDRNRKSDWDFGINACFLLFSNFEDPIQQNGTITLIPVCGSVKRLTLSMLRTEISYLTSSGGEKSRKNGQVDDEAIISFKTLENWVPDLLLTEY